MENKKLKILNLYAWIGGNRKLWWDDHEITAVELDQNIAKIYQDHFPNDTVIVADAHNYLLENFMNLDFIWSSPPCPTHSQVRYIATYTTEWEIRQKPVYPDMKLYEEILLLQWYYKWKYCIENVISRYDPLIMPQNINWHYFWANFTIPQMTKQSRCHYWTIEDLEKRKDFDLSWYDITEKRKILRNCVEPETWKVILDAAIRNTSLF